MADPAKQLPAPEISGLIARRIAQLRKAQSLSLDALATRSDISKGMVVALEHGTANPSIATLCKLAIALRVSLTELLAEGANDPVDVQIVPPEQSRVLWKGPKGGLATLQVSSTGPDMLELWEWTLFPNETFQAKKHAKGTIELLLVTEGTLALEVDGIDNLIPVNHRAVATTDKPHAYRCHGKKRTRFSMVVREPGSP